MDVSPEVKVSPTHRLEPRVASLVVVTTPPRPARRRAAARSRTAVLAGVALFLAAQALLNHAIRNDWVPVRDPVFAEKYDFLRPHRPFFEPDATSVRVMALGSSRTQLGFDANRFALDTRRHTGRPIEAFNFGCPAAGPLTCSLYLRRLLDAGAKPDVLFVEIHPGFIAASNPPFESRWLHAYRLRPEELAALRSYGWDVPTPPHHGWKGWAAAASAYRFGILNRYADTWLPCPYGLTVGARSDERGFVTGTGPPAHLRPRATARAFQEYAPVLADYHVGGPGCAAIRDTLAVCRTHGIRAAVVLMPESSAFRSWYGPGSAEIGRFADSLGVPVFDAREWVPDDGFSDGHHLTAAGSAAFIDRLAGESGPWVGGKR
jgi:hypothetical protein